MLMGMFIPGFTQILRKKIPDKLVVLTFDDATASHFSVVAPLLKQAGFGGTFFICEFPPNCKDSTKYLNWRQIKALDIMGFEVANHTLTHPRMSLLSPGEMREQIEAIERKCDSMHVVRPVTFAYPGYDLNEQVLQVLQQKNYLFARSGGDRAYDPLTDYPLLIPSWAMTDNNKDQIMGALKEARDGKIVVLTIHGVPDAEHPWVTTSPELFKQYLQYLADNHFRVIALRDLAEYINAPEALRTLQPDLHNNHKN
jgi:peptidoglycan-N-acetylglucosamine deacetylase